MVTSLSSEMGPEETFHCRWGCDLAACLGLGKSGSEGSKTPHLIIWIRQISPYGVPWSEFTPNFFLQMKKAIGWDYYLVTKLTNTVCPRFMCWLLQALPFFSITIRFPMTRPHRVPCSFHYCNNGVDTPTKWPHNTGDLPGFLFPTGGTWVSGKPLWVVLCLSGDAMWSMSSQSSYPFNAVCVGVCGAGVYFSLTSPSLSGILFLNSC